MRNQPRPGMAPADGADPGTAIVRFSPESGHRYEVEVRADATTFSTRVWPQGEWTPVVRDRTAERIVSSDPEWGAPPCQPLPLTSIRPAPPRAGRPGVSSRATSARIAVGCDKSTPACLSSVIGWSLPPAASSDR